MYSINKCTDFNKNITKKTKNKKKKKKKQKKTMRKAIYFTQIDENISNVNKFLGSIFRLKNKNTNIGKK
jgi:hypothetical protein